ncbi:HEPN domain-containing protein [Ruegeria arenilitoris]|uniref:HEPN domain-containing protein n=1 Tax=Ruegeria arenilitoris TaxID=1173585 RepID=UPI00147ECE79
MTELEKNRESTSPILFAGISEKYLQAAKILWKSEFENQNRVNWDLALIFHPLSQLLGVALETSLKGLIACRSEVPPKTHSISKLFQKLGDHDLEKRIEAQLQNLSVPKEIQEANNSMDIQELTEAYRRHHIHVDLLDRVYDRPFMSRYPILGGHSLPDAIALIAIADTVLSKLNVEKRRWQPKTN